VAVKVENNDVTTISITGTIGAGKSLVGQILEELGIPVIDTDKIVHELLASDKAVKEQIKIDFPSAITKSVAGDTEEVSRKELGKIIFKDKNAKLKLEAILHPRVREICRQRTIDLVNSEKKPKLIVTLVPLLFESKRQFDYDQVWTVVCAENILRERLAKRNGFSPEEIDLRLAGQFSQAEKAKLAHKVLDNSKDRNHVRQQVLQALAALKLPLPSLNNNLPG
jgi:dephospho-CoA kinase